MAALGIGFSVLTSSDAILMDGLFSLVGGVVGAVALRVASMVKQPDDDVYQFGYAAFEPMLNLAKGLLMAFVALFALVSAITVIFHGGREVNAGWASFYAVIASTGCFAIAFSQWRLSKKTKSPLLEVDTKNWVIDGIMSVAVALAFVLTWVMSNAGMTSFVPYADPLVVIVLVTFTLSIPAKIIRDNWGQLLGRAPAQEVQDRVYRAVDSILKDIKGIQTRTRIHQIGRLTFVQVYIICSEDFKTAGLPEFDECRQSIDDALTKQFDNLALDVIFTHDVHWCSVSVGFDK